MSNINTIDPFDHFINQFTESRPSDFLVLRCIFIENIVEDLTVPDIMNLAATCRYFFQLCTGDAVWGPIYTKFFKRLSGIAIKSDFFNACKLLYIASQDVRLLRDLINGYFTVGGQRVRSTRKEDKIKYGVIKKGAQDLRAKNYNLQNISVASVETDRKRKRVNNSQCSSFESIGEDTLYETASKCNLFAPNNSDEELGADQDVESDNEGCNCVNCRPELYVIARPATPVTVVGLQRQESVIDLDSIAIEDAVQVIPTAAGVNHDDLISLESLTRTSKTPVSKFSSQEDSAGATSFEETPTEEIPESPSKWRVSLKKFCEGLVKFQISSPSDEEGSGGATPVPQLCPPVLPQPPCPTFTRATDEPSREEVKRRLGLLLKRAMKNPIDLDDILPGDKTTKYALKYSVPSHPEALAASHSPPSSIDSTTTSDPAVTQRQL